MFNQETFKLDTSLPIVTYTDWDAECELLKAYLRYRIDNYASEMMFEQHYFDLSNVVLSSINLDPLKLIRIFSEMGFLIVDSDNPSKCIHPLTFEQWKQFNPQYNARLH